MTTILLKTKFILLVDLIARNYVIFSFQGIKKPMSQGYLESFFESSTVDWKGIYLLPGQNLINTKHCSFQYKILNNVLYLNKLLFKFRKVKSPLCSIYKSAEETIIHLFCEFLCAQYIWNQTQILLFRIYYYP